eukprot:Pgem_evm2s8783
MIPEETHVQEKRPQRRRSRFHIEPVDEIVHRSLSLNANAKGTNGSRSPLGKRRIRNNS